MIDLIRLTGPSFEHVDNRVLGLYLVKHGLTEITIFDENSQSVHASEFLCIYDYRTYDGLSIS